MYTLQILNNIITSFSYSYGFCNKYYKLLSNIMNGYSNTWCFISGNSFPILKSTISNINDLKVEWEYNSINSILYNTSYEEGEDAIQATLKVLSMNININDKTYNIDDFIEHLKIKTSSIRAPTLNLIINIWCIFSNIWYSTSDKITVDIIDNNGDCRTFDVNKNNRCLRIYKTNIEFI